MNEALKQRLIGACVLGALGVIFLPVLFSPPPEGGFDRSSQIPPPPAVTPVTIEPPEPLEMEAAPAPDAMYDLGSDAAANAEADAASGGEGGGGEGSAARPEPAAPQADELLDDKGVVRAWAVQVASFGEEQRAEALREQLLAQGHPAFARVSRTTQGTLTRVYVGPQVQRQAAIDLKRRLDRELKLDTLVVRFSP